MRYYRARPKPGRGLLIDNFIHRIEFLGYENYDDDKLKPMYYNDLDEEIRDWCEEMFGTPFQDWAYGTAGGRIKMYFKTKEEAMAFKLMWS